MRIKLESPFDIEYVRAYLSRSNKDFRQRVTLIKKDKTGTIISYARYLMSVKLGRYLAEDEEVDHINRDPTDDSIENLQVLTIVDHRLKTSKENECQKDTLVCAQCGISFKRPTRIQKYKFPKNVFCSKVCNGKFHSITENNRGNSLADKIRKINEDDLEKIKDMIVLGHTGYRISKEIGKVGTASIMRWIRILEDRYGIKYKHWKSDTDSKF